MSRKIEDGLSLRVLWAQGAPTPLGTNVYTRSDCWLLAWHLKNVFVKYKIDARLYLLGPSTRWKHVVVKTPTNYYVDVEKAWRKDAIQARWSSKLVEVPPAVTHDLASFQKRLRTSVGYPLLEELALPMAEVVAARYVKVHCEESQSM